MLVIGLYWFGEYCLTQLRTFLNSSNRRDLKADKRYIEQHIRSLDRVPQHLVVLLANEEPNVTVLTKIILWIAATGIGYVSVYDHKGCIIQFTARKTLPSYQLKLN